MTPAIRLRVEIGDRGMGSHPVIPQYHSTGFPVGSNLEVDSLGDVIAMRPRLETSAIGIASFVIND